MAAGKIPSTYLTSLQHPWRCVRDRAELPDVRIHDLRHRFAVNTLLRWYRDDVDVECHLPRLATWLGHAHVSDTYRYLSATPELMQLAARRLDRIARRLP